MTIRRRKSKFMIVLDIIIKHWRGTIGSLMVIVMVFLLIFKLITVETMAACIAALIAAGYLPKRKDDDE
jgi:hypothetical protein